MIACVCRGWQHANMALRPRLARLVSSSNPLALWRVWPWTMRVAVVLALTFLAAAVGAWTTDDVASFPGWVEAIATALAFAAATYAAVHARDLLVIEQRREDRAVDALARNEAATREAQAVAEQGQAALVAAWCETAFATREAAGSHEEYLQPVAFSIVVRNASPVPVTDVTFTIVVRDSDGRAVLTLDLPTKRLSVLPPGDEGKVVEIPELQHYDVMSVVNDYATLHLDINVDVGVSIRFRDSRGLRWVRADQGALERDDDTQPVVAPQPTP